MELQDIHGAWASFLHFHSFPCEPGGLFVADPLHDCVEVADCADLFRQIPHIHLGPEVEIVAARIEEGFGERAGRSSPDPRGL